MLERLLAADLLIFFLVFCRLGSAIMMLPGFGEVFVSPRLRLLLALAVALVATPVVGGGLPRPADGGALVLLLLSEIAVGLFIGTVARLMISALQVAGTVIGFQISLGSAFVYDPMVGQQGAITGSLLTMLGLVLLFVTDLHHLLLAGLIGSYGVFVPGVLAPVGDFADLVARTVADAFRIAMQLAAPFLLVGILISLGMGLLSRLMPQLQIFFVAVPAQILVGLLALLVTISYGMTWFLQGFADGISRILPSG